MEIDSIFETFVVSRERLLERLDSTRESLDVWIANHRQRKASITELATLEGMLAERRDVLRQLLDLDDALVDHLVRMLPRRGEKEATGSV